MKWAIHYLHKKDIMSINLSDKLNRSCDRILAVSKHVNLFDSWEDFRNEIGNELSEGDAFLAWQAGKILNSDINE